MSQAIEKTVLPSAGHLDGVPAEIRFRTITTEEEKLLFDSSDDYIDEVLRQCIVEPEDTSFWDKLTASDKIHIMIQQRILSYGPFYFYSVQCPVCGKWSEYKIDLRNLKIYSLPEDFKEPYDTFTLKNASDTEVSLKLPRLGDIKANEYKLSRFKMENPEAKGNQLYIYNLMTNIAAVNGEKLHSSQLESFVKKLSGMDSSYIKHRINKLEYGVDLNQREICTNKECKAEIDFRLRFGLDFFRTRFDD